MNYENKNILDRLNILKISSLERKTRQTRLIVGGEEDIYIFLIKKGDIIIDRKAIGQITKSLCQ